MSAECGSLMKRAIRGYSQCLYEGVVEIGLRMFCLVGAWCYDDYNISEAKMV
ncbi:hypothetical protein KIN20_015455 [Parelaphostrongylus tenuis]|uniref:Uncharacterized protein n=1 Tax=Parelaphostrongylus tenuis TaxID=148309 RepID=A0AAD5QPY5_PARTN|nr:hypothetical protein KIN20_015455 [Parelaphostrongylus tenuis]